MLRPISEIRGYTIGASDGAVGAISDFLFDDETWMVRWLVVDADGWLSGRKVLLPPSILGHVSHMTRQFAVGLTMVQVKDSPEIDTDAPVSRQMEREVYDFYGWSPYWSTGFYMGGYGYAGGMPALGLRSHSQANPRELAGNPHLRSAAEVASYGIHASDGEIGHVADLLVEDADWSLHYLVVDTRNWWPGKKVLISPRSVTCVSWADRRVDLGVDRQKVKDSPAYDPSVTIDRAYENRFHDYFGHLPRAEPLDETGPRPSAAAILA